MLIGALIPARRITVVDAGRCRPPSPTAGPSRDARAEPAPDGARPEGDPTPAVAARSVSVSFWPCAIGSRTGHDVPRL